MSQNMGGLNRTDWFERNAGALYDLIVIGGGITGCGIALDAAGRGLRTLLLEMQDFAAGTSSRSTKLVHGGLRYLKQFEVKMVAEVGRERAVVYENAPHVTTPERMMLPIYQGGTFGFFSTSLGLLVYDYLAGVKRSERRTMLSGKATLEREPLLRKEGLRGSGYYVEYRTDDARLTIETVKKAVELGATALNYAKVERLLYEDGRIAGVAAVDRLTGRTAEFRARVVVNAAGPWVDSVREMDRSLNGKRLRLTKGVHLVVDRARFPLRQAVYFDTPDKRMIFAIPRGDKAYVGTTDTFYDGDPVRPTLTAEDRDYLIRAVNDMFPEARLRPEDIESGWAGVRPLIFEEGKNPSEISRKDEIWESPSGLITIAGGKLTGYRKMAEHVVDRVVRKAAGGIGKELGPCRTKTLPLSGGDVGGSVGFAAFVERKAREAASYGLSEEAGRKLARFYGSNVDRLFRMAGPEAAERSEAWGLPLDLYLAVRYAVAEEMALTPADFFIRRTGALLFDIALVRRYLQPVAGLMGELLGWEASVLEQYVKEVEEEMRNAVVPVDGKGEDRP
ncbi:glycerol-3-phosphate dehydrogenase/oxidase [Cohnella thermotolerans]|uniref:glycerol-3-phosphate dehydrogenase/oxidase n=1 Tax=Cohnella thermotolerans TaxID=329858 RepID=UPI000420E899